jgi:hypothetical protein
MNFCSKLVSGQKYYGLDYEHIMEPILSTSIHRSFGYHFSLFRIQKYLGSVNLPRLICFIFHRFV